MSEIKATKLKSEVNDLKLQLDTYKQLTHSTEKENTSLKKEKSQL